jgi:hypothetical protein
MDTKSAVNESAVVRLHKLKQHTKALEIFVNNFYSLQIFLQSHWNPNLFGPTKDPTYQKSLLNCSLRLASQSGQEIMSC